MATVSNWIDHLSASEVQGSVPGKPGSIINIKPNNVVGKKGGEKS